MSNSALTGETAIRVKRGKVDSLSVYEITDYELELLIKGGPGGIFLNFGIFLLSVAISFLVSLATTTIESDRIFTVFVVVSIIGLVAGVILLILWNRTRGEISSLVAKIIARIPREEIEKKIPKPSNRIETQAEPEFESQT